MGQLEYWKKRCELAEMYIEESPFDPDITMSQLAAYSAWNHFKNLTIPVVVGQSEQLACDCDRQPLRYNELETCKYCGKQKPSEG